MLNKLFSSRQSKKSQELDLIEKLNSTVFKKEIILDFILNFIDNTPNDAKINKVIEILKDSNVFFGGKYIYDIFTKRTDITIELYISYEYIIDFLIKISDCNKTNDGNILLQQLTVSLNINSKYNIDKDKSVYEIIYINEYTNRNIIIYVVNDDDIINKILLTENEEHQLFYDLNSNIITKSSGLKLLQPSHNLKFTNEEFAKLNNPTDYNYTDIIIELIKYIPEYIFLDDLSSMFNLIQKLYFNFIYNYPAIWFAFLINMQDYNTYNILSLIYEKEIMKTEKPNSVININNIITKIYINNILNKYTIDLHIDDDETVEFIINDSKTLNKIEEENVKKLLLFYYKYNIFKFPYKYVFQEIINKHELLSIISPLESITEERLLTINDTIDNLNEDNTFFDISIYDFISKDDLKKILEDKENILIYAPDGKQSTIISKKYLDATIINCYKNNWLIECNNLEVVNSTKLLFTVYVKITISTGAEYYISYSDINALFHSNNQIYYITNIKKTLNTIFKFEDFEEITTKRKLLKNVCIPINTINISTLKILPTKAIHNEESKRKYEYFSKIQDRHTPLSSLLNKKLNIDEQSQPSKKSKRGGKKHLRIYYNRV